MVNELTSFKYKTQRHAISLILSGNLLQAKIYYSDPGTPTLSLLKQQKNERKTIWVKCASDLDKM